jgi:hypothetical protein
MMNVFLVERYLPGASPRKVLALSSRFEIEIDHLRAEGISIHYLGSIFVPTEESCFCRFEGPFLEVVARVNQRRHPLRPRHGRARHRA